MALAIPSVRPSRSPGRWRRKRWCAARTRLLLAALALGVGTPADAQSDTPGGTCLRLPFEQQLDVDAVAALARDPPQTLLASVARLGVDVKRVPSAGPDRPANPLLVGLPVAEASLLQQAEFRDSYEGRSIPHGALCCGLERATVLIRDTASTYTLLHEVVHLLLVPADGAVPRADLELRFAVAFHRLQVYQRRLYEDPRRLLNPLWRRDIVDAQHDVAALLFDRIRIGQSQEAIVEKVLAGCIDEGNPYFDAARRAEGRRYGDAMIGNAVDAFNTLQASVEFCDRTVRQLHVDLAAGRLTEVPDAVLSAQQQLDFAAAARGVQAAMARVLTEIESLKRFYSS